MLVPRSDGVSMTLYEIEEDVRAAKEKYSPNDFCFTYVTVQSLIEKIDSLYQQVRQMQESPL
jgi:hypothetical protein